MRLTLVILIAALMQVSAAGFAQKVTINTRKAPLKTVLTELRRQSNYDFLYTDEMLQHARTVDISVKAVELKDVLTQIFKDQPLTYTIEDKTVVIKEKGFFQKLKEQVVEALSTPINVSGIVTNKFNEPLAGATVIIKRTNQGTNTDNRGFYTLTNVDPADSIIVRFIGYKSLTFAVNKMPFHNIKLDEATSGLDEVVVQAYGRTTQRLTTSSIGKVTAAEIEKQPVNDVLLTLMGRVPGVVVTPQTGYDGGPIKIQIRGRNSINPDMTSDPLYIVDGVPLTVLDVTSTVKRVDVGTNGVSRGIDQTGLSYSQGLNPLYSINPLDIESIEVLKDGDATAIYGSRAANGVILITTKKGKPGASQLSLNVQDGATFVTRTLPQLNTQDYLAMRREAFRNDGILPTIANAPDLLMASQTAYTDWQKFTYGHAGNRLNAQGTLSGGTEQTTFRLSAGYTSTSDITTAPGGVNRKASVSLNVTNTSNNKRLYTSFTINYGFAQINQTNLTGFTNLAPNAPAVYDASGNPNFAGYFAAGMKYPFSRFFQPYTNNNNAANSNLILKYTFIKGLNATVSLGYNTNLSNATKYTPIASQSPYDSATAPTGSASFGNTQVNNWVVEPQLTYNRLIGKGTLDVLAGATVQKNTTQGITNIGTNYTSDSFIRSIDGTSTRTATDNYAQYKYAGVFGRINYVWDNKYIINVNGRRDGSSRFGPGNQFGNFGSVGLGWIASEEKWFQRYAPKAISFFKFRGSYGITGSDQVGDYQYLEQYSTTATLNGTSLTSYNGVTPLVPQLMANPDYHWQVNKKLDLALDMELFNGAFTFGVDYYRNRCNNQLVTLQIPKLTGFTGVVANSPANVQNTGLEFTLGANMTRKNFNWRNSFNIAFNRNKLLAYPGLETSSYRNQYKVGQSLEYLYVAHFTGVNPLTGLYTYEDHNGDGVISDNTTVFPGTQNNDLYVAIDRAPKFTGGYTSVFNYKKLSLTMVFYYAKQIAQSYLNSGTSNLGGKMTNIPQFVYDNRWSYPGQTNALYSKLSASVTGNTTIMTYSDANWEDASFLRFQTVTMSYSLPDKVLHKIGVRNLSFNISTNNLFVITAYKGLDPQIYSYDKPPVRTVEAGITASF